MYPSTRTSAMWLVVACTLAGCAHAATPPAGAKAQGVPLASIDKEVLRAAIHEHAPEMRSCYEKRLAADPRLQGKVAIKWVIQPDGSATDAMVAPDFTTLNDAEVHACMTARIATWRFPRPKGGGVAIITYPWVFRALAEGAAAPREPAPAVLEAVGAQRATVNRCYEQRLAVHPELEGRVLVGFTLQPGGRFADVAVVPSGTTLQDAELHRCITDSMATWSHPFGNDEPARAQLPFVFRRGGSVSR